MQYSHQQSHNSIVMALFPNTRGVGFSLFSGDNKHLHSKMLTTRRRFENQPYLKRIKTVLDSYRPEVLVLEEYRKNRGSVKTQRIRSLIKAITLLARERGVQVYFYRRKHIRDVFAAYNVMTKHSIAELICFWVPELKSYLYKKRNARMEPYSSAVFEAASLIITYFYLDA